MKRSVFRLPDVLTGRVRQGLLQGGMIALVVLVLWLANLFTTLRLGMSNLYFLRSDISDKVIIVGLDNASLSAYGRSPVDWDRAVYGKLINVLNEGGARVVAFDMIFAESAQGDEAFAQAITEARFSDANRTRVIMPIIGAQRHIIEEGETRAVTYQNAIAPTPILRDAVENLGYVNVLPDVDGTVRRQLSLVEEENGETRLSLGLAAFMAYSGIPPAATMQLLESKGDRLYITPQLTPDRKLYVGEGGLWLQNFFGAAGRFPVVSMIDVVEGKTDPALFKDKVVLVGSINATGLTDRYPVPIGITSKIMAGVEIHANAVETLLRDIQLHEQGRSSQAVMIVLLSMIACFIYYRLRWYWMLCAAGVLLAMWGVCAFILFDTQHLMLNLFHSTLALSLPVVVSLGANVAQEARRRQSAELILSSVVEVSQQRLVLDKVLPSVAEYVKRGLSAPRGSIWLWDDQKSDVQLAHAWSATGTTDTMPAYELTKQAAEARQVIIKGRQMALPIMWQQRLLGSFFVEVPPPMPMHGDALRSMMTLTEQLAPSLENAILYTATERQKTLLEGILTSSPSGILVLGRDQKVIMSNPGIERSLMLEGAHLVGQPLWNLLERLGVPAETQNKMRERFKANEPFREELRLDKHVFHFDAAPLGMIGNWVVILNDVSLLIGLNELQTRLIRMASHDLKNPLARVMGFASLLADDEIFTGENREMLGQILKASDEMNQLINDILNLEKIRAGRIQQEPVQLVEIIQSVIDRHQQDMQAKHQTFSAELPDALPIIMGDYRSLTEAFSNLLGNAIKYTPDEGRISLSLALRENMIHFEVKDTGYGIPKDAQAKLFTPFYRVRTEVTAHIAGTGLGLSLVKEAIEAHEGRIRVESEEGAGTTFFVEIPIPT